MARKLNRLSNLQRIWSGVWLPVFREAQDRAWSEVGEQLERARLQLQQAREGREQQIREV